MAIEDINERVIIEFLGKYEFDALPWRVPFEKEASENISPHDFFKKNYANVLSEKQINLFEKISGPFDIIAVKNKKFYFFLMKKQENSTFSFSSEEEKDMFFHAKKKKAKVYIMTNPYPEHLFKVYNVPKAAVKEIKININKCKEIELETL